MVLRRCTHTGFERVGTRWELLRLLRCGAAALKLALLPNAKQPLLDILLLLLQRRFLVLQPRYLLALFDGVVVLKLACTTELPANLVGLRLQIHHVVRAFGLQLSLLTQEPVQLVLEGLFLLLEKLLAIVEGVQLLLLLLSELPRLHLLEIAQLLHYCFLLGVCVELPLLLATDLLDHLFVLALCQTARPN